MSKITRFGVVLMFLLSQCGQYKNEAEVSSDVFVGIELVDDASLNLLSSEISLIDLIEYDVLNCVSGYQLKSKQMNPNSDTFSLMRGDTGCQLNIRGLRIQSKWFFLPETETFNSSLFAENHFFNIQDNQFVILINMKILPDTISDNHQNIELMWKTNMPIIPRPVKVTPIFNLVDVSCKSTILIDGSTIQCRAIRQGSVKKERKIFVKTSGTANVKKITGIPKQITFRKNVSEISFKLTKKKEIENYSPSLLVLSLQPSTEMIPINSKINITVKKK